MFLKRRLTWPRSLVQPLRKEANDPRTKGGAAAAAARQDKSLQCSSLSLSVGGADGEVRGQGTT